MDTKTIAIIGVGHVGATIAYSLIAKNIPCNIILVDADQQRCMSELGDLEDSLLFSSAIGTVTLGTIAQAAHADIILITAGMPQKPAQPRSELLETNTQIIEDIAQNLTAINPRAIVIVVSNPVDALTAQLSAKKLVPAHQLFGAGTLLDTMRLRVLLAQRFKVPYDHIDAFVFGEHGETQFIPWSLVRINGKEIAQLSFSPQELDDIAQKIRTKVYSIIEGKLYTYYGIASGIAQVCKAIIFDEKTVFPASHYSEQWGVFLSTPCVIGQSGIERVVDFTLTEREQAQMNRSAQALKAMMAPWLP